MQNSLYDALAYYYPFASYLPYLSIYSPILESLSDSSVPAKTENLHLKDNLVQISRPITSNIQSPLPSTCFDILAHKKAIQRASRREIISDKQYKPNDKRQKRKAVELKGNRNVLPTKLKQMLSYLGKSVKSQQIVGKYFARYAEKHQFTAKRYYSYIKLKRESVANYITLQMLFSFLQIETKEIFDFSQEEQFFYLRLVRILFAHFLKNVAALCSLGSNRIKKEQKQEHLRTQRLLMYVLSRSDQKSVE